MQMKKLRRDVAFGQRDASDIKPDRSRRAPAPGQAAWGPDEGRVPARSGA